MNKKTVIALALSAGLVLGGGAVAEHNVVYAASNTIAANDLTASELQTQVNLKRDELESAIKELDNLKKVTTDSKAKYEESKRKFEKYDSDYELASAEADKYQAQIDETLPYLNSLPEQIKAADEEAKHYQRIADSTWNVDNNPEDAEFIKENQRLADEAARKRDSLQAQLNEWQNKHDDAMSKWEKADDHLGTFGDAELESLKNQAESDKSFYDNASKDEHIQKELVDRLSSELLALEQQLQLRQYKDNAITEINGLPDIVDIDVKNGFTSRVEGSSSVADIDAILDEARKYKKQDETEERSWQAYYFIQGQDIPTGGESQTKDKQESLESAHSLYQSAYSEDYDYTLEVNDVDRTIIYTLIPKAESNNESWEYEIFMQGDNAAEDSATVGSYDETIELVIAYFNRHYPSGYTYEIKEDLVKRHIILTVIPIQEDEQWKLKYYIDGDFKEERDIPTHGIEGQWNYEEKAYEHYPYKVWDEIIVDSDTRTVNVYLITDPFHEAQGEAIEEIKKIKHLSEGQRNQYIDKVNRSKTTDEINNHLSEAKNKGKKATDMITNYINTSNHLDPTNAADYLQRVDAELDYDKAFDIMEEAVTENQNIAIDKVNKLPGLSDTDPASRARYIENIKLSLEPDHVDGWYVEAKRESDFVVNNAIQTINSLNNLTNKQDYLDDIDKAKNKEEIDAIVKRATEADKAAGDLDKAKKDALNDLINVNDKLFTNEKDQFVDPINNASSFDELNDVLKEIKNLEESTTKFIADSKHTINNLKNLNDDQRSYFNQEVDDAISRKPIEDAVAAAIELDNAISNANNELDELKNLTKEQRDEANKAIAETIYPKDVEDAVAVAKAQDKANLDAAKKAAKEDIDSFRYPTPAEKKSYKSDIDNAESIDKVLEIVNNANRINLDRLIEIYENDINNDLEHLTPEEKKDFVDRLNAIENQDQGFAIGDEANDLDEIRYPAFTDIRKALENNQITEDQANQFRDKAFAENTDDGIERVQNELKELIDENELDKAKEEALNNLENNDRIIYNEKDQYADQIGDAESIDQLNEIQKQIDELVGQTQEFLEESRNAVESLKNLTDDEKQPYLDKIKIDDKTTRDEIKKAVEEAKSKDAEKLKEAKDKAQQALEDNRDNLSDAQEKDLQEKIDQAETADDAKKVEEEINNTSKENKEAKDKAQQALEDNRDNLSDAQEKDLQEKIDQAETADDAKKVEEEINNTSKENKEAKDKAQQALEDNRDNLSDSQEKDLQDKIDQAETAEEAKKVEEEIINTANENKDAKDKAQQTLEDNRDNLSDSQEKDLQDKIDQAETAEEAKKVEEEIKEKVKENQGNNTGGTTTPGQDGNTGNTGGTTNPGQSGSTGNQGGNNNQTPGSNTGNTGSNNDNTANPGSADDNKTLDNAKEDGKKKVDEQVKDGTITPSQGEDKKNRIEDAKTPSEVDTIVNERPSTSDNSNQAEALDNAKNEAKAEVDKLTNLSDAEKANAKSEIDAATTLDEVTDALREARNKDLANSKEDSSDKTTDAISGDKRPSENDDDTGAGRERRPNGQENDTAASRERRPKDSDTAASKEKKGKNPKTGVTGLTSVVSTLAISMAGIVAARKKNEEEDR